MARQWLDLHSKPNLRSHQDNEERYRIHVAPFFGDAPLLALDATRVLELRARLQATGRKPRTVNLVLALVRSIPNFAVANGHVPASPLVRLARGKLMLPVEKTKLEPPIASPEDVGRLLEAIREVAEERRRPGMFGFFAVLAYTGLRRGEALGLRWSDVNLDRRIVTVRRSYDGLTKSGKHRIVPIAPDLVPILKAHRLADPWKADLVFPNEDGVTYSRDARLQVILNVALARVGLRRIRVHDLRHNFASHFVMNGGDIFTLQRILGHSTPQLTSDTYAHLSPDHMVGAADRISFRAPRKRGAVVPMTSNEAG